MKNQLYVTILFLLLGCGLLPANDYIKYGAGYHKECDGGLNGVTTVEDSVLFDQGNWKQHQNFGGLGKVWIYTTNSNNLFYYWNGSNSYCINLDAKVGSKFNFLAGCNDGVTIAARDLVMDTAAGHFTGVVQLTYGHLAGSADCGLLEQFFAPGVGVIKYSQTTIAGPVSYEFSFGMVQGVTYPKPTITAKATSDQFYYTVKVGMNHPPVIPKAALTVELLNESAEPITFNYTHRCHCYVIIRDASGNVVKDTSIGQSNPPEAKTITINAGETYKQSLRVSLTNQEGGFLSEGAYTIEVKDTGSLGHKGIIPISISLMEYF